MDRPDRLGSYAGLRTSKQASKSDKGAGGTDATGALAIARMNEDYLNLDYNLVQMLVVVCANVFDPTRKHAIQAKEGEKPFQATNWWLENLCEDIDPEALVKANEDFIQKMLHAAPSLLRNTRAADH